MQQFVINTKNYVVDKRHEIALHFFTIHEGIRSAKSMEKNLDRRPVPFYIYKQKKKLQHLPTQFAINTKSYVVEKGHESALQFFIIPKGIRTTKSMEKNLDRKPLPF